MIKIVVVMSMLLSTTLMAQEGVTFNTVMKDGKKTKVFFADTGPGDIDVSKYPDSFKSDYPFVKKKCEKCHVFARTVNTSKEPSGWDEYVERMTKKRRSGIREKDKKRLVDWLIYDNKVRPRTTPNKPM